MIYRRVTIKSTWRLKFLKRLIKRPCLKRRRMGTGSSTTQLLDARKSSDATSEGRHKKSSHQQSEVDATSLANKYESTKLLEYYTWY